jgi:hypothetical protein
MCTVTLIARRHGYALGMNRDEQLTRVKGRPPKLRLVAGRKVVGPAEPGGGTWIALNDSGATFALINWYSITVRVKTGRASRGAVVNAVSAADSVAAAARALAALPLKRLNPFRLIAIFPAPREVVEWRWNLKALSRRRCAWKTQQWISSGFDEPAARRIRSRTFRTAQRQRTAGSLAWLRRLHRSHLPERGPFSTCMHRADAATVSYTEVTRSPRRLTLRYQAGALCQHPRPTLHSCASEAQTSSASLRA